jgi:hypothetical protein
MRNQKRETKSSNSNEGHKEELNEVSYNEDEDQLEEEQDLKESLEVFPTTMNECLQKRLLNI